jgi:alkylation response protein AidB-like acyl-CoA dehydrogenase
VRGETIVSFSDFLLSDEEKMIRQSVKAIVEKHIAPYAIETDENSSFPWKQIGKLSEAGLMGIMAPEEYGGIDGSKLAYVITIEEIAKWCAATAVVYFTQTHGLLPISLFGTTEQKQKYIPRVADGSKLAALAVTEPDAGSDVASMKTNAERTAEGYVLNGSKIFITTGDKADFVTVFAKTGEGHNGLSTFLVEKGTPGFTVGNLEKKMGIRGSSTASLFFEDCFVPEENRIGEEGEGFKMLMKVFDYTRISTAAQALGIAQGAYETAFKYAQERNQFKKPIYDHQAIQFMLVDMYTEISAAKSLLYQIAVAIDKGQKDFALEASLAKLHCSELAGRVTNNAVQILGGHGYVIENHVERMMRDAKITQIYDGTSQIQKLIIGKILKKNYR